MTVAYSCATDSSAAPLPEQFFDFALDQLTWQSVREHLPLDETRYWTIAQAGPWLLQAKAATDNFASLDEWTSILMTLLITSEMAALTSTTIRTALVDYRAELLRLTAKRPEIYGEYHQGIIAQIDAALLEIEGNVCSVLIQPLTCSLNG